MPYIRSAIGLRGASEKAGCELLVSGTFLNYFQIKQYASVGVENRVRNYILHARIHIELKSLWKFNLFSMNSVYGCVYTTFSNNSAFNELSNNLKIKHECPFICSRAASGECSMFVIPLGGRRRRDGTGKCDRQRHFENGNLNVFRVPSARLFRSCLARVSPFDGRFDDGRFDLSTSAVGFRGTGHQTP